ncbi:MAG: hypothetical protein IPM29_17045 [Planctomycetes bacterium]|nr:hypothetical protein [Planctomycetota bacterium]
MSDLPPLLTRLLARLRAAQRRRTAWWVVLHASIPGAVACVLSRALAPGTLPVVAGAAGAWIALRALWAFARAGFRPAELDAALGLGDRLRTLCDARVRQPRPRLLGWLAADVEARLLAAPPQLLRGVGRRALGRFERRCLALLLVLLLVLPYLPLGALPFADSSPELAQPEPGDDGARPDDRGAGTPRVLVAAAPEPAPTPATAPESGEAEPDADAPPDRAPPEPSPLLDDLPSLPSFALPQFIGDGPSTRTEAPVAGLDDVSPQAPAAAPPPPRGAAGDGPVPPPVEPESRAFERALERALRARHVRPDERPFVRAWFEAFAAERDR